MGKGASGAEAAVVVKCEVATGALVGAEDVDKRRCGWRKGGRYCCCCGLLGLSTLAGGSESIRHSLPEFITIAVEFLMRSDSSICLSMAEENKAVPSILK